MYPPAPPVGVLIAAAPLEPPKQDTLVCEAGVTEIAVGCIMVKFLIICVASLSVIVHV